jgi:hypothetical protein
MAIFAARRDVRQFNAKAGEGGAHSKRWVKMNFEVGRRTLVAFLLTDRQSENGILVIETFHPEPINVKEAQRRQCVMPQDQSLIDATR